MQQPLANRRVEPRVRLMSGRRMSWQNESYIGGHEKKAWVLDVSQSGLGLMIERDQLPECGDVLGIRLTPAASPLSYEVVRLQEGRQRIAVVGCRRVFGRTANLPLPIPSDHAQAA